MCPYIDIFGPGPVFVGYGESEVKVAVLIEGCGDDCR